MLTPHRSGDHSSGDHAEADAGAAPNGEGQSYREVLAELVLSGWTPSGVGDWAVVLRSPNGRQAARISPFDPAYPAFVELCRRCPGNRYLPHVDLDAALAGGGSLTVLDFLTPAPEGVAAELFRQWARDEGDAELAAVKAAALAVDADHRARVPWWNGVDVNPDNVRQSADGRPTLVDLFCLDGPALYGQILEDAAVVRRLIPEQQRRYLLEIPYLARMRTAADLRTLREAWARRQG